MSNSPYDLERRPQPTADDLAKFNAGVKAARLAYHGKDYDNCACGARTMNRKGKCAKCAKERKK